MIRKIIILILIVLPIYQNSYSKSPPLGTGSLVPSNIMIMLDNSGSMGWDLNGNQLSSSPSFLSHPTDLVVDSSGDVYVIGGYSNFENKLYKMHVFGADGTFKRRMLQYQGNY